MKIVFYYSMGFTAKRCAENVGCSRQSVQTIFSALGDRVEFIMKGNYPSPETTYAAEIMSIELRAGLKTLKEKHKNIEGFYVPNVTYDEYKNYRNNGKLVAKSNDQEKNFHLYNIFRTLHELSHKSFGVNKNNFHKYFSFCKFMYLLGIVVVKLSQYGHIEIEEENTNVERSMFCFEVLLLSLLETPLVINKK